MGYLDELPTTKKRPNKVYVYKTMYSEPRDRPWRVSIAGMDEFFCERWSEAWRYAILCMQSQNRVIAIVEGRGEDPQPWIDKPFQRKVGLVVRSERRLLGRRYQ